MKNVSFIGLYSIVSIIVICASIILAILRMTNIMIISWLLVVSPILGAFVLVAAIFFVAINIDSIKSIFCKKKYITKNIVE